MRSRTLRWDGCVNVRDLGGHRTEDGRETRFGAVVRSDTVRGLTPEGWEELVDYGIRRIVDLRWHEELAEDRPVEIEIEIELVHVPLFGDPHSFERLDEILGEITDPAEWRRTQYETALDWYRPRFAEAVRAVAEAPAGGVVVHCAGGVDRTGLVVALLLRLAGVSIEDIAEDWAASEQSWAPFQDEWIEEAEDDAVRERRRLLSVCPPKAMRDVVYGLERRHGSASAYLLAGGATREHIEAARRRLRS